MTTRSQKREAVAEISGQFEASTTENNQTERYLAGRSRYPKIQPEILDEIKTSLRKENRSDLTRILAENQKEMLKSIAPVVKKPPTVQILENSYSELENVLLNTTSTPIKTKATTSKTTPVYSRNIEYKLDTLKFKIHISSLDIQIKCGKDMIE